MTTLNIEQGKRLNFKDFSKAVQDFASVLLPEILGKGGEGLQKGREGDMVGSYVDAAINLVKFTLNKNDNSLKKMFEKDFKQLILPEKDKAVDKLVFKAIEVGFDLALKFVEKSEEEQKREELEQERKKRQEAEQKAKEAIAEAARKEDDRRREHLRNEEMREALLHLRSKFELFTKKHLAEHPLGG